MKEGSGWVFDRALKLYLNIAQYQPLRGRSYLDLPPYLKRKQAIINVKNKDSKCFQWAVLSALHPPQRDAQRVSHYRPYERELDFDGIEFPVTIEKIPRFEARNNIAVSVFGYDDGSLFPVYVSRFQGAQHINLLLISKGEQSHYCWIKDLNRLLYDQTKHRERKYFCRYCLQPKVSEQHLLDHVDECKVNAAQKVVLPDEDNKILRFENYHKQLKVPFVIYADFEAITTKIEGPELDPEHSGTLKTQEHEPCGFSYIVVRSDGQTKAPVLYRGENAVQEFFHRLREEESAIMDELRHPKQMVMEREDWRSFNRAQDCHICGKELDNDRVRDHCHITGKFRGAAHNACNLKWRISPKYTKIPVVFHNLRGYDGHLLMSAVGEEEGRMTCIPNNMEKYITFSLRTLQFIDSAQFMLASLDKLVNSKAKDGVDGFAISRAYNDPDKLPLLLRKGVYPYDYMDSMERFQEQALPSKNCFYSQLNGEGISDEDYEHAQNVWKAFAMKNMGDYHDLYLKTDTLLLADVFETFRDTCLAHYGLDPAHYYTSPGLSWDALLKTTGVELELLTDYDKHLFFERGIRGGISMVSKRHATANNPMVEGHDSSKPNSWILYLDANNLYGHAMSQSLPTGGFRWLEENEINAFDVHQVADDSEKGYVLEVDLEYPRELHDEHDAYPLAPERLQVCPEWMSQYQIDLNEDLGRSSSEVEKLVPSLRNKTKYTLHYRNLKLYLSLGMRLTKIHRIIEFDQRPWMASYIALNTELRKKAKTDFEKDLFKLMNNSVFGKTMENLRKRVSIKLVRGEDEARRQIAKPSFVSFKVFNDSLAAVHMRKTRLVLNRPIYIGLCVLDLSKHLMYDFYYNNVKKRYGDSADLLYTDTDSLLLEITTPNVYTDIREDIDAYDTSDYPQDHPLHSMKNKKVLGKMKDECAGRPIAEFVGLRPKMYSILEAKGAEHRRAKGVKKSVVKRELRHEQYKQCLLQKKHRYDSMNMIRSDNHRMFSVRLNKVSLSPMDTKRWIADDGISTHAYGHYAAVPGRTREEQEMDAFIDELFA